MTQEKKCNSTLEISFFNEDELQVIDSGYNYAYRIYQPKYRYDKKCQGFDYTTKGEIN